MRILFSAGFFPTQLHPFASFIADMAKAMVANGHDVTIVAPQSISNKLFNRKEFLPDYEEIPVKVLNDEIKFIQVYRPKIVTFGESKLFGRLTFFLRKLGCNYLLNKLNKKFDIAYAHFWENGYNIVDYVANHNLPMIVVSGEDNIVINNFLNSQQIKLLTQNIKKVICVSTKNKHESIQKNLTSAEQCVIIPNGPDLFKFHPESKQKARKKLGLNQEDFLVAFVGRFINRKGPIRLIKAIEQLNDELIKGIFIGKSSTPDQEPKGNHIAFKGIVSHEDIYWYLSAADIYVLPTLAEGCSNSIVEAMACGLPIISSDLPFNYDILDSSNSILINPENITEIATAIRELKDDPDKRLKLSQASLAKATELSFDKRVIKIFKILEDVISNSI